MKVYIIAEAGVNHNGDPALAERLVDAAAEAGADAVKFQTFTAERLVTRTAARAAYQITNTGSDASQFEMLRSLEVSEGMHRVLKARAESRGIAFLSTPFDVSSIALLARLGLQTLKIGSGEITNLPCLRAIGRLGKLVILSTGMADLEEVRAALNALVSAGTPKDQITVLHCHTDYPTAMEDVNLRAMITMRESLGIAVGYSDHTLGIEVPIAAVALGATVIEKHFTLDRTMRGPDHVASLEPGELSAMVRAIRNIEAALGDGVKRPTPREAVNVAVARKSIVAARDIAAGEHFTEENLTVKRPGGGLSPMVLDRVIGQYAPRTFTADEPIML